IRNDLGSKMPFFLIGIIGFVLLLLVAPISHLRAAESEGAIQFHKTIEPVLTRFCYECHGQGSKRGGVALDQFASDKAILENRDLWWRAMKMLRAGIMPPKNKPRPSAQQVDQIAQWIKSAVFQIDPKDPDPGQVTVRRLNRVEYRNTIR